MWQNSKLKKENKKLNYRLPLFSFFSFKAFDYIMNYVRLSNTIEHVIELICNRSLFSTEVLRMKLY